MNANESPTRQMLVERLECFSCAYDLRGLPIDGVCPECGLNIRESMRIAALRHPLLLPPWLRIARSAYLAAAATLLSAPWLLPAVRGQLGWTTILSRHAYFNDAMFNCGAPAALFGIVVGLLLIGFRSRWGVPVLFSATIVMLFAMSGLSG